MEGEDESPSPGENELPLWGHVKILDGFAPRCGTNMRFLCDYCSCVFRGSYSTVKAHLLKISKQGVPACPGVTFNVLMKLSSEVDAAEDSILIQVRKKRNVTESCSSDYSGDEPESCSNDYSGDAPCMGKVIVQAKRKKSRAECRDNFDAQFARMFYSSGYYLKLKNLYIFLLGTCISLHITGYSVYVVSIALHFLFYLSRLVLQLCKGPILPEFIFFYFEEYYSWLCSS